MRFSLEMSDEHGIPDVPKLLCQTAIEVVKGMQVGMLDDDSGNEIGYWRLEEDAG